MSGEELRSMMRERESAMVRELTGLNAGDSRRGRVIEAAAAQRRRSSWGRAAVAAAAVVALGVGAWVAVGLGGHAEPIATPQPSASASPTASPSAPVSGIAFPEPLPADGFFLEASRMTDAVWAQVTDGWTLTYWQPSRQAYGDAGHDVTDPGLAAIYLMSPEGDSYELAHFGAPSPVVIEQIAWWEPGAIHAIVSTWSDDASGWRWLDLTTGALEDFGGVAPDASLIGWDAEDRLIFAEGAAIVAVTRDGAKTTILDEGGGANLSPDGTLLVTAATDDTAGPRPATAYSVSTGAELWTFDVQSLAHGDEFCNVDGWAAPNEPAVVCQAWGGDDLDYTVGPASFYSLSSDGATNFYTVDDGMAWSHVQVAADGVVATASDPNHQGIGELQYLKEESGGPLLAPAGHGDFPSIRTVGSVEITRWSSEAGFVSTTARDVSTGALFEVTPAQQSDPDWWWTTREAVFLVGGVGGAS